MCAYFDSPTLYVGKTDSHLYASTSLVHKGVAIVVSSSILISKPTVKLPS